MIELNINTGSKVAVYKQLVSEITSAVMDGRLKAGDLVPSMNELAERLIISKETVKRAYGILREKGILEAQQGKGFYVTDESSKESISVLFIFDKFSTYKQEIVRGFHQELKEKSEDTILLFNQDFKIFEYFINENFGKYDYYIVSPHFSLDPETQRKAQKVISRIPNHKLIMIDNWISKLPGNYGASYQDFANDVYEGLSQGKDGFRRSSKLNVITLPYSLYGSLMKDSIRKFAQEQGLEVKFFQDTPRTISKGDVFLILNGQLDSGLISLVDKANETGLAVGEDYFIISYNESPVDKVVLNGLTTISTDFNAMGQEAAKMINEKRMWKKHIPFRMNRRRTF